MKKVSIIIMSLVFLIFTNHEIVNVMECKELSNTSNMQDKNLIQNMVISDKESRIIDESNNRKTEKKFQRGKSKKKTLYVDKNSNIKEIRNIHNLLNAKKKNDICTSINASGHSKNIKSNLYVISEESLETHGNTCYGKDKNQSLIREGCPNSKIVNVSKNIDVIQHENKFESRIKFLERWKNVEKKSQSNLLESESNIFKSTNLIKIAHKHFLSKCDQKMKNINCCKVSENVFSTRKNEFRNKIAKKFDKNSACQLIDNFNIQFEDMPKRIEFLKSINSTNCTKCRKNVYCIKHSIKKGDFDDVIDRKFNFEKQRNMKLLKEDLELVKKRLKNLRQEKLSKKFKKGVLSISNLFGIEKFEEKSKGKGFSFGHFIFENDKLRVHFCFNHPKKCRIGRIYYLSHEYTNENQNEKFDVGYFDLDFSTSNFKSLDGVKDNKDLKQRIRYLFNSQ